MATLVLTYQDLIDTKKKASVDNIRYNTDEFDVVVYRNGDTTQVLKSDIVGD